MKLKLFFRTSSNLRLRIQRYNVIKNENIQRLIWKLP